MRVERNLPTPQSDENSNRAANGGPVGAGHITFGQAAEQLLSQGFESLPIRMGGKAPAVTRWSSVEIDDAKVAQWCRTHANCGVGLRTGRLIGLDIDCLDAHAAHRVQSLAEARFGATLVRVGQWPKRLLLYRADQAFPKLKSGSVEILGAGQQFVAFGSHSGTGKPYYWPTGETVLDYEIDDLPLITEDDARSFLAEVHPGPQRAARRAGKTAPRAATGPVEVVRRNGWVVDGRDAWLSQIAFHSVHDLIDRGETPVPVALASLVWERFANTTDLDRPRSSTGRAFDVADATRKVTDKLDLLDEGRLPGREVSTPTLDYTPAALSVEKGRTRLQEVLSGHCEKVLAWHRSQEKDPPSLGVRATVGLGKSRAARAAISDMMPALRGQGLPHRVLVFTPSHALAEETACAWRDLGIDATVLRGYERKDPTTGDPMCRDIEMVRAVLASGLSVQDHACRSREGNQCRFFESCLKQQNRKDAAVADVVVAPYDALFSGLAFSEDNVALILVDEGCWQRAVETCSDLFVEDLLDEPLHGMGENRVGGSPVAAMADLSAFRQAAARALRQGQKDMSLIRSLRAEGLTHKDCQHAAKLEEWRRPAVAFVPGLDRARRAEALRTAKANQRIDLLSRFWRALADLLRYGEQPGQSLQVRPAGSDGRQAIEMRRVKRLHDSLRGKPVLHLDATLRQSLAEAILPPMEIECINVAAPHMHVRLVTGSFGKSMICPLPGLPPEEFRRRENRLRECVDYVRWHALRVFPRDVLVVTYQAIEPAFIDIPNVVTAHFNAVAGLDIYKDVAMLIGIGRPLPPSQEAEELARALFGGVEASGYVSDRVGLYMRTGRTCGLVAVRHKDETAETLRAAICDDELVQAIGRGRGVNRTAANSLEVHILADVALPLVYDRLTSWDAEKPDPFQQMLLASVAVNSPADAAALHPELFGNSNEAKLAIKRSAFKGQNPMYSPYREMTLKSAAYRRDGRGRCWQRVWWVSGDEAQMRCLLETALGKLSGWRI
ncbi:MULTISPECIES: bifunctional DNA primase/polymerase [Roseovarius]|uniref:bifunctional DNA primase/polymerase n=1 Tax=Roseovarius TaxID=74030 RepID=UPI00273FC60D|nr:MULTISPECIES: bifunctional DNA primase/polymerase [unclassified Roseovarius]